MGFYSVSTITHDAKLHGLKFWPIDVQHSEWDYGLEALNEGDRNKHTDPFAVRLGFRCIRGLRRATGDAIAAAKKSSGPFTSEYDLKRRVPSIRKNELVFLQRQGPSLDRQKT
jgi:error-prone DNA polymerase